MTAIKIACVVIGLLAIGYVVNIAIDWNTNTENNCHSTFQGVTKHLSTSGPYIPPPVSALIKPPHLEGCKAEAIWLVSRHGTRNPSDDQIVQMKTTLPNLQAEIIANSNNLCSKTLSDIADWKAPNLTESDEYLLVAQGRKDLIGLGTRYKQRFPELLGQKYDNSTFKFKFTNTERAEQSCKSFVSSLFGEVEARNVWYPNVDKIDPVLRFYKDCGKWKKEVDHNAEANKEQTIFQESTFFKNVLQNIQHRLGFNRELTLHEVELMYSTCSLESAWNHDKISPWCSVFDENDVKALEYREDLSYYWIQGYGHEINYEQACPPVKDLVNEFQNRIDNPENSPNVVAYFSHSGLLLKLLTRLGLYKDTVAPRSDNYASQTHRKFQTSKIDSFSTNMAFLLHKCSDDYVISAFFQELPIKLPGCDGWLCKFSDFKSNMSSIINNCDLPSICKITREKK